MAQAVPIWTSGMAVAFLPTCNSAKDSPMAGLDAHATSHLPGHCHLPKGERLLLRVCPVIHHVLWKDMMVFPHIGPNSKIHYCIFSMLAVWRHWGFLLFLLPDLIENLWVLSALCLTPASLIECGCIPKAQHQRMAVLLTAFPIPPNGLHTLSHLHPHRALREKVALPSAPSQASVTDFWRDKCQQSGKSGTQIWSVEKLPHWILRNNKCTIIAPYK